ncbi:MAG TPA: choice-of-anchor tandem repeat GloVer-containing protein [Terriglobales bacterium]
MTNHRALLLIVTLFALSSFSPATNPPAGDGNEQVLYKFHYPGPTVPQAGVIFDSAGNLYGTASGEQYDPAHLYGAVFMLSPGADGTWSETVLHNFGSDYPIGGLVLDKSGNLYGATAYGGRHRGGTIFELTPNPDGSWTNTVLYEFGKPQDGTLPNGGLVLDADGNLYGTTYFGGGPRIHDCAFGNGCGTVFELSLGRGGKWKETIVHSFSRGQEGDGEWPTAGLAMDASGNLYGGTFQGGWYGQGVVFKLSPVGAGHWHEKIICSFYGNNGGSPSGKLVFDQNGNLYGTTRYGNERRDGAGNVFELAPQPKGQWTETIIHNFYNDREPISSVVFDAKGNLYTTTTEGGHYQHQGSCYGGPCGGSLFEFSPGANGTWTSTVLHDFGAKGDGVVPTGDLIIDSNGNIYGTTGFGGNLESCDPQSQQVQGCGTVYEITP